jgi:copper chaperone CopZ
VSVALRKLDGVESVEVSLTEGKAIVKLRPGNAVSLRDVRDGITRGGFTPREAAVTVRGILERAEKGLEIRLAATRDVYALHAAAADVEQALEQLAGRTVQVEGVIPIDEHARPLARIDVASARAVPAPERTPDRP